MDLENDNILNIIESFGDIEINDENYKNFDSKTIKKNVKDKVLRKKALNYYRNQRYSKKLYDENLKLKKKHCYICNCDIVLLARHNKTQHHLKMVEAEKE